LTKQNVHYGYRPPIREGFNAPPKTAKTSTSESASVPNLEKMQEEPASSSGPAISQFSLSSNRTFLAIKENTVYIAVHTRSPNNSYRCGVFVTVFKEGEIGAGWYGMNAQGNQEVRWSAIHQVILDKSLILLYEAGKLVEDGDMSWVKGLRKFGANGSCAPVGDNDTMTGLIRTDRNNTVTAGKSQSRVAAAEHLDSTTSVQKAMGILLDEKLITVPTPFDMIKEKAFKLAGQLENTVMSGRTEPLVT